MTEIDPDRAIVKKIVEDDPRYYYRAIKRDFPAFYDRIFSGDRSGSERLWCWLYNDGQQVQCAHCKSVNVKFQSMKLGFYKYCSNKCSANDSSVRRKFEETSFSRYGVKNPRQNGDVQARFYETMESRYGVDNALEYPDFAAKASASLIRNHTPEVQQRREKTNTDRFGVAHAAQSSDIKARTAATNLERYGVDTPLRDPRVIHHSRGLKRHRFTTDLINRVTAAVPRFETFVGVNGVNGKPNLYPWTCLGCGGDFEGHIDDGSQPKCPVCHDYPSTGEYEIRKFLEGNGVDFQTNVRSLIPPREIDIFVPDRLLAIEYNGLFWHCDHKVHRNYHLEKMMAANERGLRLVQIFESEWQQKREVVESRLLSFLGRNRTVFARRCAVVDVSPSEAGSFMDVNHIQGRSASSTHIGLRGPDGVLVAVMTFSRARFSKSHDFEMTRYANALRTNVVGGAGRLLATFERRHPGAILVSYSDRRWNTGDLYRRLGFAHEHTSTPNYYYSLDRKNLLSRQKFQKHKLPDVLPIFDKSLSESENMYANGYIRIWDCGNDVFVKRCGGDA